MTSQELRLLQEIHEKLVESPEFASNIYSSMSEGLQESAKQAKYRAADMETVAYLSLNEKLFKSQRSYIASLLTKWEGKTSLVFTKIIKKLEE